MYRKISLSFKSGFITPLESDTLLGYVFANNFTELQDIFSDFVGGDIPFLLSNGFQSGVLPKPLFFQENEHQTSTLERDIEQESIRKNLKKITYIPINSELFELSFSRKDLLKQERYDEILTGYMKEKENFSQYDLRTEQGSDFKNTIPRFSTGEVTPFAVSNVTYSTETFVIYVRIFNEEKFQVFFESMKNTFETIGRGAKKSVGYGKIKDITLQELNKQEQDVFTFLNQKKENEGIYYVLNNYKPVNEEISHFDTDMSFLHFTLKHGKIFPKIGIEKNSGDGQAQPFKGRMSFISPGSVIKINSYQKSLKGGIYQSGGQESQIFNFGYIF